MRINFFSVHANKILNHHPSFVTDAPSVKAFKLNLDNCWSEDILRFHYNFEINQSELKTNNYANSKIKKSWIKMYKD